MHIGALTVHLVALWWLGALLAFAAAAVTMALQVLFGVLGTTVLVFVILDNPSAGGPYQSALLLPFWRALSSALRMAPERMPCARSFTSRRTASALT